MMFVLLTYLPFDENDTASISLSPTVQCLYLRPRINLHDDSYCFNASLVSDGDIGG